MNGDMKVFFGEKLPPELIYKTISFLEPQDFTHLLFVSHFWQRHVSEFVSSPDGNEWQIGCENSLNTLPKLMNEQLQQAIKWGSRQMLKSTGMMLKYGKYVLVIALISSKLGKLDSSFVTSVNSLELINGIHTFCVKPIAYGFFTFVTGTVAYQSVQNCIKKKRHKENKKELAKLILNFSKINTSASTNKNRSEDKLMERPKLE